MAGSEAPSLSRKRAKAEVNFLDEINGDPASDSSLIEQPRHKKRKVSFIEQPEISYFDADNGSHEDNGEVRKKKKKKRRAEEENGVEEAAAASEEVVADVEQTEDSHASSNGFSNSNGERNSSRSLRMPDTFQFNDADDKMLVSVMDHCRFADGHNPSFTEHVGRPGKRIYSFTNKTVPDVTFVGKERVDDDYNYSIAIVNRRTKEVTYRPAAMLHFEGKYKIDRLALEGKEQKKRIDYSADHSIKGEDAKDIRRQLTAQFGSDRSNKMLETAGRRMINDSTLQTMAKTTFAGSDPGDLKKVAADLKDIKPEAKSSVLPKANTDTTIPSKIYPKTLFYSAALVEQYGLAASEFFKIYSTKEELLVKGIPKFVAATAARWMDANDQLKSFLLAKMCAMSYIIKIARSEKTSRLVAFESGLRYKAGLPEGIMDHVFSEYTTCQFNRPKVSISNQDYDRLLAHCLAMLLIYNDFVLPVSVFFSERVPDRCVDASLRALGCQVSSANAEQAIKFNSHKVARLIEPPGAGGTKFRRRR